MNKKIFAFLVFVFIASVPMVSSVNMQKPSINADETSKLKNEVEWDGEFLGGIPKGDNEGELAAVFGGYFKNRNRGGFFAGIWSNEDENKQGEVRGIFGKHIIIGKIINDQGSLPFIGFIKFNNNDDTEFDFIGRAMSIIGPAPYFVGTFSSY